MLKKETAESTHEVAGTPADIVARLPEYYRDRAFGSESAESPESPGLPPGSVWIQATVGSGFFQMNPATLVVHIVPAPNGTCQVTIQAEAMEGLIKQRTAPKAVRRFAENLP